VAIDLTGGIDPAREMDWKEYAVGLLLFAPGITFIAAVQVIATANASLEATTVAIIVVVVINAALVWLPLLVHIFAPGVTTRYLTAFNGWLRANGNKILIGVLLVGGLIVAITGALGLASDPFGRGQPLVVPAVVVAGDDALRGGQHLPGVGAAVGGVAEDSPGLVPELLVLGEERGLHCGDSLGRRADHASLRPPPGSRNL